MPVARIAITLDRDLLREVDSGVRQGEFRNRNWAIEAAVREKLDRQRKRRLTTEARNLNPKAERALAEESLVGSPHSHHTEG